MDSLCKSVKIKKYYNLQRNGGCSYNKSNRKCKMIHLVLIECLETLENGVNNSLESRRVGFTLKSIFILILSSNFNNAKAANSDATSS